MENRLRTKKKAKTTQKYKNKSLNEEYPFYTAEYNFCPPCEIEVLDNKEGVRCNSLCNTSFHLECIGMPSVQYMVISQDPNYKWDCQGCKDNNNSHQSFNNNTDISPTHSRKLNTMERSYPSTPGSSAEGIIHLLQTREEGSSLLTDDEKLTIAAKLGTSLPRKKTKDSRKS